ncbi:MAG: exodeoxyribonuclease V subunit gamma [Parachlamydiales bacterium]
MKAYQSSDLEWLADRLGEHLFAQREPCDLPSVVVPNGAVKEQLIRHLARRFGVVMGVRFLFLEEAIHEGILPSRFELAMRGAEMLKGGWLASYLEGHPERLYPTAYALAGPLSQWPIYGGEGALEEIAAKVHPGIHLSVQGPLHVFGFNHLPPLYFHHLMRSGSTFYLFSPCAQFWTDLEQIHPLLASWGTLHRRLLKGVEEAELEVEEYYPVAKGAVERPEYGESLGGEWTAVERPWNRLASVQSDLLLMRNGPPQGEGGLVCYAAKTRREEVECAAEGIIARCRQGMKPSEMRVMAPDITPYVPYLEAIFEREGIPYTISDIGRPPPESVEAGLLGLLSLLDSRWEASRVAALLTHPLFAEKQGLSGEEIGLIRLAGIRWGRNREHCNEVLEGHNGVASWEGGFDRLFRALTFASEEALPLTEAEGLGKFIISYKLLESSVLGFFEPRKLADWERYLAQTAEACFGRGPGITLATALTPDRFYPFEAIRPYLEERWGGVRSNRHPNRLDGVRCGSLLPMRTWPCGALFLLGMDEGAFPRRGEPSPFDFESYRDPIPTPGALDRALFLEAIFSTREAIAFSYCSVNREDGQPQSPSPLLIDLLHYGGVGVEPYEAPVPKGVQIEKREVKREVAPGIITLDVRDLRLSATDPLRLYFRQVMGIDPDRREGVLEDEEPFHPDSLEATLASWARAGHPGVEGGLTAAGPFGKAVAAEVERRAEGLKGRISGELTMLPVEGFEVELEADLRVRIVGELGPVSHEGLVLFSKGGVIRAYPHLLLLAALVERDRLPYAPQLHSVQEGKRVRAPAEPMEHLKRYLRYHLRCLSEPAPLHADLMAALVQGKIGEVSERAAWLWPTQPEQLAAIGRWRDEVVEVFGGCLS